MKKIVLLLLPLLFQFNNVFAWGWAARDAGRQTSESPSYFLGDKVTFHWDVNNTGWGATFKKAGIGTINNSGSLNWQNIIWVDKADDGDGGNEGICSAEFQLTSVATWYYSLWLGWGSSVGDNGRWYNGNSTWTEGSGTFICSSFTVNALNTPASCAAALNATNPATQIDLSWTKDGQSHNVMILRKKSTESWTAPTQGSTYAVGALIGAATVVYNGSGTSFTDNVSSSTSYDYKFYSENYSYYSDGVTSTTVTTNTAATDYFRSKTSGDWNSISSWESSSDNSFWIPATAVPVASSISAVILDTHTITLSADATVKNLSIRYGGIFNLGSNTLTIAAEGSLSNNDGGTFNSGTGKVNYYGDGSIGNFATFGGTLSFYNVEVKNGGIDFGSSSTITGSLLIQSSGWIQTHGPSYGVGSTLKYNTGGNYNITVEWNNPYNVLVTNSTALVFNEYNRTANGDFTIEEGSSVTLSGTSGKDLYVKGDFINNGTFNSNNREVIFEGSNNQEINGSSATTFSYLRINNAAGITINASNPVTVTAKLTVDAGNITINPLKAFTVSGTTENNTGNSCITVKSDATGTGSLIHNTAGIKGTIERYITGSADPYAMMYHFVSVPLDTANASYSGLFEGAYLFYFREDTNYWKGLGSPLYTPLDETRGYLIYYILGNSTTYTFEGNMNYTSFTPHLESHATSSTDYTHGWNLIPNPFPSAINWGASGWTKTDIGGSVYLWPAGVSSDAANYCIWNGSSGTGNPTPTGYIPSGQSFFVHASSTSPSLVIPASAKAHNSQAYYKNGAEIVPNLLRMRVFGTDSTTTDDIVVHFRDDATSAFDNEFDAFKLTGGYKAPQLSTITSDGINVAINSLPLVSGQQIVPVKLKYYTPAQLKFSFEGIENFEHQPTIFLEDKLENRLIDLTVQPEYTFDYSTNDTARFNLIFTDYTGTEKHETSSFNAYQLNDKIRILYPELSGNKATVRIFDMTGKLISSNSLVFEDVVSVNAPAVPGVYVIQILSGNRALSRRIVVL